MAEIYNLKVWINYSDKIDYDLHFSTLLFKSGYSVVDKIVFSFKPVGYTAIWLLKESHFALHTFPEKGKTYIELSGCIKEYNDSFLTILKGSSGISIIKIEYNTF